MRSARTARKCGCPAAFSREGCASRKGGGARAEFSAGEAPSGAFCVIPGGMNACSGVGRSDSLWRSNSLCRQRRVLSAGTDLICFVVRRASAAVRLRRQKLKRSFLYDFSGSGVNACSGGRQVRTAICQAEVFRAAKQNACRTAGSAVPGELVFTAVEDRNLRYAFQKVNSRSNDANTASSAGSEMQESE